MNAASKTIQQKNSALKKMIQPYRNRFLYFFATRRSSINFSLGLALVFITIIWVATTTNKNLDFRTLESWWNAWGDPLLGLSTFLVAIVIWLSNTAKDWEERLDKKLTVSYRLQSEGGREVIHCENAFLSHEGDIRNWGQSLGQQTIGKNKQQRLVYFDFSNTFKVEEPQILHHKNQYFKHFSATFYLKNLPKDELENGYDIRKGKFVWEADEGQPKFVEYTQSTSIPQA